MSGEGFDQASDVSEEEGELEEKLSRASLNDIDGEEEREDSSHGDNEEFVPGPLFPLKDQLELDKEDDSLQRWKVKLLGCIDHELNEDNVEPEVTVLSLGVMSKGRPEITLQLPLEKNSNDVCFTLKEGSNYSLKVTFVVRHNIVSGLAYANTVWKGRIQVDHTQVMLGTFSPRREPYIHVMEEETAPSGVLARGSYTAKTKFVDDDGRCHLEVHYPFDIRKDWKGGKAHTLDKVTDFESNKGQDNLLMATTNLNTSATKMIDKRQWWARNIRSQFIGKRGSKKKGDKSSFRDGASKSATGAGISLCNEVDEI